MDEQTKDIVCVNLDMGYAQVRGLSQCGTRKGMFHFVSYCRKLIRDKSGFLDFFRRLIRCILGVPDAEDITYRNDETGERCAFSTSVTGMTPEDWKSASASFDHDRYIACFRIGMAYALWNNPDIINFCNDIYIQLLLPSSKMMEDESWRQMLVGRHRFTVMIGKEVKSFDFELALDNINIIGELAGFTYYPGRRENIIMVCDKG